MTWAAALLLVMPCALGVPKTNKCIETSPCRQCTQENPCGEATSGVWKGYRCSGTGGTEEGFDSNNVFYEECGGNSGSSPVALRKDVVAFWYFEIAMTAMLMVCVYVVLKRKRLWYRVREDRYFRLVNR